MESSYWSRRRLTRRAALRAGGATGAGAAAFGLVGCGDDDGKPTATPRVQTAAPSAAGSPSGAASPSATAARTATAMSAADLLKLPDEQLIQAMPGNIPKTWDDKDIKTGGRLNFLTHITGSQNPFAALSPQTRWSILPVYNNLLRYNVKQGLKNPQLQILDGDLATKWETPDLQTVVVTLAPGVKFQNIAPVNGRAMTFDDIKYSWQKALTHTKSTVAKLNNSQISAIEDIGNNQIRLKFTKPEPLAAAWLATSWTVTVVPKEIADDDTALEQKPVGSGAFIQKSFTPNVDINYDKNPDYFKKDALGKQLPYMDGWRAIVQPLPESRLATYLADQADMSLANLGAGDAIAVTRQILQQAPNTTFQVVPPGWGYMSVSGKREEPIWNDVRVRRAFSMLVPRDAMIKSLFKGSAGAWPEFPWGFLFDSPPQLKDMGKWWEFNPKDAKALLDAAGVGNREWSLEYYDSPSAQGTQQLLLLQDEAGKAGVKITLAKQADYPTILTRMAGRQFKDLSFHHHNQPLFIDPAGTMTDFVAGQPQNEGFSRANDPAFNEFYKKLSETPVGPARTALGKQVWDYMLDQVMEISLLVGVGPTPQHPRMQNWVNTAWAEKYVALGGLDQVWLDPSKKLK